MNGEYPSYSVDTVHRAGFRSHRDRLWYCTAHRTLYKDGIRYLQVPYLGSLVLELLRPACNPHEPESVKLKSFREARHLFHIVQLTGQHHHEPPCPPERHAVSLSLISVARWCSEYLQLLRQLCFVSVSDPDHVSVRTGICSAQGEK